MLASPWTTSSRRRAATIGVAPHCAALEVMIVPGRPLVTPKGKRTHSTSPAQGAASMSSGMSREAKTTSFVAGSARSSAGTSSRA